MRLGFVGFYNVVIEWYGLIYLLHLRRRDKQIVDTIQVLSVEKANLQLPFSISSLKDLDLSTQGSA